ncbi:MAG TPA: hypothetical protein VKA01_17140 [Vicinamibacteria bacterium]|nr:hypothetical protein [Vicinamibacteria bacterium]
MGRILDLCGEVAAEVEEGPEGPVLHPDSWERLRGEWTEEEIEDAVSLVRESLFQGELVDAADSLSVRLVDLLGVYGEADSFEVARRGGAGLTMEVIGQLARRIDRLEEILDVFRSDPPPDRRGFEALRRRLADLGIEDDMAEDRRIVSERDADEEDGD